MASNFNPNDLTAEEAKALLAALDEADAVAAPKAAEAAPVLRERDPNMPFMDQLRQLVNEAGPDILKTEGLGLAAALGGVGLGGLVGAGRGALAARGASKAASRSLWAEKQALDAANKMRQLAGAEQGAAALPRYAELANRAAPTMMDAGKSWFSRHPLLTFGVGGAAGEAASYVRKKLFGD